MTETSIALSQVTTSGIVIFVINWLKKSSYFPWITAERTRLLRVLGVMGAGLGSLGIHYVWNPQQHSLLLTGLSLTTILVSFVTWVKSFVTQEIIYRATMKNGTGQQLATLLQAFEDFKKQLAANPPKG